MKIIKNSFKFNDSLSIRPSTKYIVLHHAGFTTATAKDIHSWHLSKGWAGIGYHYYIRKEGIIYAGRPENTVGQHSKGSDLYSIEICCEGNYEKDDFTMPETQYNSLVELISDLKGRYQNSKVVGHNELYVTSCPGKNFPLKKIKSLFNSRAKNDDVRTVITATPTGDTDRPDKNVHISSLIKAATLKHGDTGLDVKRLQAALFKAGYYKGKIDGIFGTNTETALKSFQAKHGIDGNGILNPKTLTKMSSLKI